MLTDEQIDAIAVLIVSVTGRPETMTLELADSIVRTTLLRHRAFASGVMVDAPRGRVLLESDAFCPSCGHNRDKSSVSSVDLGDGRKGCQFCAQEWDELPARGVKVDATALLLEAADLLDAFPGSGDYHGFPKWVAKVNDLRKRLRDAAGVPVLDRHTVAPSVPSVLPPYV